MYKCEKCGMNLNDDCIAVWKCSECNKAYKVSFSKLYKIQEAKKQKQGQYLIKCSSCGNVLDDGNEKIVCKCSSCGNVSGGNLAYFVSNENETNNDEVFNTSSYYDMIECPECKKKILNDSKICSYCGYPLTNLNEQVDTDTRIKKPICQSYGNINKILISIICAFILVFFGMIIYNGKTSESKEANGETNILPQNSVTESSYESTSYENGDSKNSSSSSSTSIYSNSVNSRATTSAKSIEHYCEADGCYKEGTKAITGFSGKAEYYCPSHYQEIQDIISMMEEDVGSGTYSKHQCEECSKEGTRELIGFSGRTEYYCTEHYNEIVEIINMLNGDE